MEKVCIIKVERKNKMEYKDAEWKLPEETIEERILRPDPSPKDIEEKLNKVIEFISLYFGVDFSAQRETWPTQKMISEEKFLDNWNKSWRKEHGLLDK
jgi:hypothetical protein